MPISAAAASPSARLVTPAVERVTEWHREHSLRQARALLEAMHDDDPNGLEDTPAVPPGAMRVTQPSPAAPMR